MTKEELIEYYINQKHSVEDAMSYFKINSRGVFFKTCKELGIKKYEGLDNIKNKLTPSKLKELYVDKEIDYKEIAKQFKISSVYLYQLLKEYNLLKNTKFKDALININKIELEKYNAEHNLKETANHFNISRNNVVKLLDYHKIKKIKPLEELMLISKEELYKYYIKENNSLKETLNHFNINNTEFNRLIKQYNINKYNIMKQNNLEYLCNKISKEEISNYYIKQNYSLSAMLKLYNLTKWEFKSLCDYYNIVKCERKKEIELFKDALKRIPKEELEEFYITKNNSVESTLNHFNITQPILCRLMSHYDIKSKSGTSYYETELLNYLSNVRFESKNRTILEGKELDLYSPELKLGIEFNGDYWHSSLEKDKNYHFNKSKLAESKGIRLIHIYEYEWNDEVKNSIIKSLLNIATGNIKERIYARKCEVREISNIEAKQFNNINHLQGHRNAQVTYGLFYNNKLVQLMSFSKTKYNKNLKENNDWEIIRGCPGSNNIVIGGVSKLFKHFVNKYNPEHVFSYCDFNKFDGKGYEALGMKFVGYTGPDFKWLMPNHKVVNRYPKRHKELKEQAKAQIWGSGSKKYLWVNPNFKENQNEIC